MSYVLSEDLADLERNLGRPLELSTTFSMSSAEMDIVRGSQRNGRAHDITMFIHKGKQLLFNAKHFYPKELLRAPSGGSNPGETIEAGAKREAYEETGAVIELERYLARINVRFYSRDNSDENIDWTSYVLMARYISGEIEPIDTHEIREARFVDIDEIPTFNKIMKRSDRGGFHYRAYISEKITPLIVKDISE